MSETNAFPVADLTAIDQAFPATVKHLMPKYEDIPEEFRRGHTKWNKFFDDMFYSGIKILSFVPKDGVNANKAFRHLRTIAGSFEPQHEHKEAAVAYMGLAVVR